MVGAFRRGRVSNMCVMLACLVGTAITSGDSSLNSLLALVTHVNRHAPADFDGKVDFVRTLTFTHSVHEIDRWHDQYAFHTPTVVSLLHLNLLGTAERPHLSCGPRTLALNAILERMGIHTRVVHIFDSDPSSLQSHTYLEISDDRTNWQIQDADYNIFYERVDGQRRVDTLTLLTEDPARVVPCSAPGRCGWKENGAEILRDQYFDFMIYDLMQSGQRSNVAVVNLAKVDLTKRYSDQGGQTIEEILTNLYNVR